MLKGQMIMAKSDIVIEIFGKEIPLLDAAMKISKFVILSP